MTKKAIVSFANNSHIELLAISIPTMYRYANKHNYDFIIPSQKTIDSIAAKNNFVLNRPAPWFKIPILIHLLNRYDIVLWLDADIVINKYDLDILDVVSVDDWVHGFVAHQTLDAYIPNMGVWMLNPKSLPLLIEAWAQEQFINHAWWEQRAVIELMQWNQKYSKEYQPSLTNYGSLSVELPFEWNMHKHDIRYNTQSETECRFLHATMYSNRLETMSKWAIASHGG